MASFLQRRTAYEEHVRVSGTVSVRWCGVFYDFVGAASHFRFPRSRAREGVDFPQGCGVDMPPIFKWRASEFVDDPNTEIGSSGSRNLRRERRRTS